MLKNGLSEIVVPRFCLLILSAVALFVLWSLPNLNDQIAIKKILINKSLHYVDKNDVDLLLEQALEKNFFTLDLKTVAQTVNDIAWVDSVQVKKIWPDILMVNITEQTPIARWGNSALISAKGELFTPSNLSGFDNLPRLEGKIEQRNQITDFYYQANQMLLDQDLSLVSLEMNSAFDWRLELNNGLVLILSSRQGVDKLKQLRSVYAKHIIPQLGNIAHIDLRYDAVFVVAWRDDKKVLSGESLALR